MDPYTLLGHHLGFAKGRHIHNLVEVNEVIHLAVSGWIESPSWNHVVVKNLSVLDEPLLNKITQICIWSGRLPALYTIESLPEKKDLFLKSGYDLLDTEYWMTIFPKNFIYIENSAIKIQPVVIDSDVEKFVKTFKLAFNSLESGYAHQLYLSLIDSNNHFSSKAFHIYAICKGKTVGIGSIYYNSQYAGIYNLAVTPDCHGMGIGSALVNNLINHAKLQGCKIVFLQADITSKRFYGKLGFTHSFSGEIYAKL